MKAELITDRLYLRELTVNDVTEKYLNWLRDGEAKRFIQTAVQTDELRKLTNYVLDKIGRDNTLFLGIFDKANDAHIGNIKYEPVDSVLGYAIMGILIGEPSYRGRGVGTEAIVASAQWLKQHRGIKQILLGVDASNSAGIKSYQKAGFIVDDTPYIQKSASGQITMVWNLK